MRHIIFENPQSRCNLGPFYILLLQNNCIIEPIFRIRAHSVNAVYDKGRYHTRPRPTIKGVHIASYDTICTDESGRNRGLATIRAKIAERFSKETLLTNDPW